MWDERKGSAQNDLHLAKFKFIQMLIAVYYVQSNFAQFFFDICVCLQVWFLLRKSNLLKQYQRVATDWPTPCLGVVLLFFNFELNKTASKLEYMILSRNAIQSTI